MLFLPFITTAFLFCVHFTSSISETSSFCLKAERCFFILMSRWITSPKFQCEVCTILVENVKDSENMGIIVTQETQ